jgi:HSP20 family protein
MKGKKDEKSFDSVLGDFNVYFHEYFGSKLPVAFVEDLGWKPPTDVYETDEEFVIRIEVGGIAPHDVATRWGEHSLIVSGKRREEEKAGARTYHNIEITTGPFERRIAIPSPLSLDRESLRMVYRHGILEIRVKKTDSSSDRTAGST